MEDMIIRPRPCKLATRDRLPPNHHPFGKKQNYMALSWIMSGVVRVPIQGYPSKSCVGEIARSQCCEARGGSSRCNTLMYPCS